MPPVEPFKPVYEIQNDPTLYTDYGAIGLYSEDGEPTVETYTEMSHTKDTGKRNGIMVEEGTRDYLVSPRQVSKQNNKLKFPLRILRPLSL